MRVSLAAQGQEGKMTLEQFSRRCLNIQERYDREMRQAIRRRNLQEAAAALAGMDALERIRNEIAGCWYAIEQENNGKRRR